MGWLCSPTTQCCSSSVVFMIFKPLEPIKIRYVCDVHFFENYRDFRGLTVQQNKAEQFSNKIFFLFNCKYGLPMRLPSMACCRRLLYSRLDAQLATPLRNAFRSLPGSAAQFGDVPRVPETVRTQFWSNVSFVVDLQLCLRVRRESRRAAAGRVWRLWTANVTQICQKTLASVSCFRRYRHQFCK